MSRFGRFLRYGVAGIAGAVIVKTWRPVMMSSFPLYMYFKKDIDSAYSVMESKYNQGRTWFDKNLWQFEKFTKISTSRDIVLDSVIEDQVYKKIRSDGKFAEQFAKAIRKQLAKIDKKNYIRIPAYREGVDVLIDNADPECEKYVKMFDAHLKGIDSIQTTLSNIRSRLDPVKDVIAMKNIFSDIDRSQKMYEEMQTLAIELRAKLQNAIKKESGKEVAEHYAKVILDK